MPLYEYECAACGPFEAVRPMAQYDQPHACPDCGVQAPRAFLTAPNLAGMPAALRQAHATNERSAHEPRQSRAGHGPNCGCCGSKGSAARSAVKRSPDGAKSFPSKRPWMISH